MFNRKKDIFINNRYSDIPNNPKKNIRRILEYISFKLQLLKMSFITRNKHNVMVTPTYPWYIPVEKAKINDEIKRGILLFVFLIIYTQKTERNKANK